MRAFTVRDLREHTGALVHQAEAGKLSIVTKHGRPVFVAVPLDDFLLEYGVHTALAIDLFQEGTLSLAKAAKLSGVSLEAFMEQLASLGIPVVDYPPSDLDEEITHLG